MNVVGLHVSNSGTTEEGASSAENSELVSEIVSRTQYALLLASILRLKLYLVHKLDIQEP